MLTLLSIVIGAISATMATLTYLRVSRKFHSKTMQLSIVIKPQQEQTIFDIDGIGSLQRLDIGVRGMTDTRLALFVDGEVFLENSLLNLCRTDSLYTRSYTVMPNGLCLVDVEVNLTENFFKNLRLLLNNKSKDEPAKVAGTLNYNIYEPRFRLHLRKSPSG
jgi:hypothetical protein